MNLAGGAFAAALRAEWMKLRTIRGWVVAAVLLAALPALMALLNHGHSGSCLPSSSGQPVCGIGHPFVPSGPDGEAVADSYYLLGRQLAGDGTMTVRVARLTGVTSTGSPNAAPSPSEVRPGVDRWAKAGLIVTASTRQGAPYAAAMVTPGHGVRFQYDYTHDLAGLRGPPSSAPRWLRLTRSGERVTAYDSITGTTWQEIGSARIPGLPSTVTIGLFVTSPVTPGGLATLATGTFDHVSVASSGSGALRGQGIGQGPGDFYDVLPGGGYARHGATITIRGSGDIALGVTAPGDTAAGVLTVGLIAGLIVAVVLAATFITSEYRQGLIRTTLAAMPERPAWLAAKGVVIGGATLTAGVIAAAIAIPLGEHVLTGNGNYIFPATVATQARVIVGAGVLLALTAIALLAVGVLMRRTAPTVLAGIIMFALPAMTAVPYITGQSGGGDAPAWVGWLLRLTPAAALSVLTSLPRSAQVSYHYTLGNGYPPLSPAAGLAVLAIWALVLLAFAAVRLNRADA